ncbi:MAG: glycosyltransferase family 2 protein [Jatrophihabitantaceae bacterium]
MITVPGDPGAYQGFRSISYVMPIRRWAATADPDHVTEYLRWLSTRAEVIVVDGSTADLFNRHHELWGPYVTHVPVAPGLCTRNGKVGGVLTGAYLATSDVLIIADDDVRYDAQTLRRAEQALDDVDLVRPQNYFDPLPWHARWDTARTLLNRAFGGDYPGTFIVRRSAFLAIGGYNGDVLFENLELLRAMKAAGARIANRPDIFVQRIPPTIGDFRRQRVRHAYESLAQPLRFTAELGLLPTLSYLIFRHKWKALIKFMATFIAAAEFGRRRHEGRNFFPPTSALFVPAWLAERALCAWVAAWHRLHGGVQYSGENFLIAAHRRDTSWNRTLASMAPERHPKTGAEDYGANAIDLERAEDYIGRRR